MNVERDMLQGKIEKKNHKFLMMSQLQWYGKRCGTTHNLKSQKWLDDNLNAMNVEWIAGQGTI